MSYYLKNELEIKSYDALYKIAEKEKLVDVYSNDMTKKELIDLILNYRGIENQFFINQYIDEGFIRVQEFIDNNIKFHRYFETDIDISHKIVFYENIKIKKGDGNVILINKNIDVCENIVLLVGNNNYIYSICYLQKDYNFKNDKYVKYYICNNNITRYINKNIENEVVKLLFFNKYITKAIFNLYNNFEMDLKPKNIIGYEVIIPEFSFISKNVCDEILPIIFMDNKIICDYFSLDFSMYIYKINNENEIEIMYFEDSKNILEKYEYQILGTHIYNVNELFFNDKQIIRIFDNFGFNKYIEKSKLISLFMSKLKEEINYYSKKYYSKYYIIGQNIKYPDIECFSYLHFINYWVVTQSLNKIKNGIYTFEKYLIINSTLDCIEASSNRYEIIEKDINYEICVNSNLCSVNNNVNYNLIIDKIFLIIKHKICEEKYIRYDNKEVFQMIDNGNYHKINVDLQFKADILEEKFPTNYLKNKNKLTKEYMKIYKNYITIRNLSEMIYKEYIYDESKQIYEFDFALEKYNKLKKIIISRYEIDYVFIIEIYNFLNMFFSNNLSQILNEYKGITLIGNIIKSKIFYDILKEFIPGKMISFDLKHKKSELQLLETAKKYIEDTNLGKIKYNFNIEYERINFAILAKNFKEQFELVFDSNTSNIGYIDKISASKKLCFKIKNEKNNVEKTYKIDFPDKYNEIDENFVDIEQNYLNSIENGITRIFFKYDKSIEVVFINRIKDQIFVSNSLKFDII
ncbi:hypothetical protein [Caviibacter abscessus]|uniref:hypothetical protein n=1 Tax=Caviibacter abscessus TaxID=1766719 RepID=UPI00083612D6|nr:hypothetical protein [Caviibacter abscessus]